MLYFKVVHKNKNILKPVWSMNPLRIYFLVISFAIDINSPFKNQLRNYAAKKQKDMPDYSCLRKGPIHAPQFMATVKFDGQTFDSDQYYHTIKEAEQAAARVALMSLPMEEIQQDDGLVYKSLLLQLAQKQNVSPPKYNTTSRGDCHLPVFSSVVEIKGEVFEGDPAKTKKQAETNAAKVAWNQLNGYKLRNNSATASVSGILENPIKVALKDEGNMESSKFLSDEQKTASPSQHTITPSAPSNINNLHSDSHSYVGVALISSPKEEIQQDDRIIDKNILHDSAQNETVSLPKYSTSSRGDCTAYLPKHSTIRGNCHMPKKQEVNNAAKVAWMPINESKLRNYPVVSSTFRNPEKLLEEVEDNTKSCKLPSPELKSGAIKLSTSSNGDTKYLHRDYHADKGAELISLTKEEFQQGDHVLYKNLLQELAQKERVALPKYDTISSGNCQPIVFCSVVEMKGEFFKGDPGKTKKQAEMNAAKVAWIKLNERKVGNSQSTALVYVNMDKPIKVTSNEEVKIKSNKVSSDEQETASPDNCTINLSISSPNERKKYLLSDDHLAASTNVNDQGIKEDDIVASFHMLELDTPVKYENINPVLSSTFRNLEKSFEAALDEDNTKSSKLPLDELKTGTIESSTSSNGDNKYLHRDYHADKGAGLISLTKEEFQQGDQVSYKGLLQELAQKERVILPKYNTISRGNCQTPVFSSVVEIKGEFFEGDPGKTKKQAEMNAAKVAWIKLNERKVGNKSTASGYVNMEKPMKITVIDEVKMKSNKVSSDDQETMSHDNRTVNSSISSPNERKTYLHSDNDSATSTNVNGQGIKEDDVASFCMSGLDTPAKCEDIKTAHGSLSPSTNAALPHPTLPASTSSLPASTSPSINSSLPHPTSPSSTETGATLLCNKVQVFPRKSDMVLPEGATLLPLRDDTWVAVCLG